MWPVLLASAFAMCAPTPGFVSQGNGWSLRDSLCAADVIVTGDLMGAAGSDGGDAVRVAGQVRVVDSIYGSIMPGTRLNVRWKYQPFPADGPQATTNVPPVSGLWLLRRTTESEYEALRVQMAGAPHGGAVLPLDAAAPLIAGSSPGQKIAAWLAGVLTAIADAEGARLNPGGDTRSTAVANRFDSVADFLMQLDPADSEPVLRALASAADPNLRVLGLAGGVRAGEVRAIAAVLADSVRLAQTLEVRQIGSAVNSIRTVEQPALVEALGSLALSHDLFGADFAAASRISYLNTPAGLPYSAVLLENPDAQMRSFGIGGFCTIMRPFEATSKRPLERFWNEETRPNCPDSMPVQDRERERAVVDFWKNWWRTNRDAVETAYARPLARPQVPRWRGQPVQQDAEEVPIEVKFRAFVHMMTAHAEARPAETPPRSLFAGRLNAEDDARLAAIVGELNAKWTDIANRTQKYMNDQRVNNRTPETKVLGAFWREDEQVTGQALDRVRRELSSPGWAIIEAELLRMRVGRARADALLPSIYGGSNARRCQPDPSPVRTAARAPHARSSRLVREKLPRNQDA